MREFVRKVSGGLHKCNHLPKDKITRFPDSGYSFPHKCSISHCHMPSPLILWAPLTPRHTKFSKPTFYEPL